MTLDQDETREPTAEPQPDERATGGDAAAWPREKGRPARFWEAFRRQPALNGTLAVLCIAAIALAILAIGPASQSGGQTTRTTTVKRGVVQSTVSGSGSIQSASELNLGFETGGTVSHIYVEEGQEVAQGQLIATLDPQSADVSLEQAKATLKSAEATLAQLEENEGESISSGSSGSPTPSAASASYTANTAYASSTSAGDQTPSETTQTTPTTTQPATKPTTSSGSGAGPTTSKTTTGATESVAPSQSAGEGSGASSSKQSAATREANLASARATVQSDKLSVESAEKSVQNTKLYAPESGTIVSLSGEVGETVSGTGTTRAQSSASNSSSSSGAGGTGSSNPSSRSSTPSSSSEGSSSAFAVLNNLNSLQLVVGLSESEVGQVHVGQIATVTVEALSGRKAAAHVVKVGQVPSSSGSGAVSYDVTFRLDQHTPDLKVGMSATAEVVVKQAEGLSVPTSTIKGGTVTVLRNGKHVTQAITTGLAGDSSTIILSGLKEGEEVLQTIATGSSGSSLPTSSGGSSRLGGLPGGGGGFPSGGAFPAGGPPG